MTVAMGVGRFAYTPLLPLMQTQAGLTHAMAGFVASANLAGYLAGVLAATGSVFRTRRLQTVRAALACVVISTAAMAIPSQPLWMLARFATGVGSGLAFVLGSSIVLDRAVRERHPEWIGVFYSGVGLGIVLSAIFVPIFGNAGGWRAGWLGIAGISALLFAITLPWLSDPLPAAATAGAGDASRPYPPLFWWLVAAYGGEGMGYIIPATFIVAMIAATPGLMRFATASWIVVGVVAMPSTVLWNRVGMLIGRERALVVALLVMGAGTIAPIVFANAAGVAIAAATLGGTFLGVTALANALSHELQPHHSQVGIGRLTTSFGVGQIVGPAVAGALVTESGSYTSALLLAAGAVVLSAAAMTVGTVFISRS